MVNRQLTTMVNVDRQNLTVICFRLLELERPPAD